MSIERAAEKCVNVLLELIKTKVNYVVQEGVIVIKVGKGGEEGGGGTREKSYCHAVQWGMYDSSTNMRYKVTDGRT